MLPEHVFFRSDAGYLSTFVLFRSLAYLACGRAAAVSGDIETARESNLFRTDPNCFLALDFVKAFPVHAASPFSLGSAENIGRFCSLMRKDFNVGCLNSDAVSVMRAKCFCLSFVQ